MLTIDLEANLEYVEKSQKKKKRHQEQKHPTIANAFKARRARNELHTLAIEKSNKTADRLIEKGETAKEKSERYRY